MISCEFVGLEIVSLVHHGVVNALLVFRLPLKNRSAPMGEVDISMNLELFEM